MVKNMFFLFTLNFIQLSTKIGDKKVSPNWKKLEWKAGLLDDTCALVLGTMHL